MAENSNKSWLSLVIGVLLVILGLIFVFNSNAGIGLLNIAISIVFILIGVFSLIDFFRLRPMTVSYSLLITAALTLILGILFLFNFNFMSEFIAIIFGAIILLIGVVFFGTSFYFKRLELRSWWIILIASIVSIIFAIVIFFIPGVGTFTITLLIGLYLIFIGAVSIASFFIK